MHLVCPVLVEIIFSYESMDSRGAPVAVFLGTHSMLLGSGGDTCSGVQKETMSIRTAGPDDQAILHRHPESPLMISQLSAP